MSTPPFEKYNFKQYLNEHKNHFQNVDKTKFNITCLILVMQKWVHLTPKTTKSSTLYGLHDF